MGKQRCNGHEDNYEQKNQFGWKWDQIEIDKVSVPCKQKKMKNHSYMHMKWTITMSFEMPSNKENIFKIKITWYFLQKYNIKYWFQKYMYIRESVQQT